MSDINLSEHYTEGATLLNDIEAHLRRFVSFQTEAEPRVMAAWIMHTHMMGVANSTPYIYITSDVMRSGKTRLLEVIEQLCFNAERTVGVTPAALYYMLNDGMTTLLIDEIDTVYGPGKQNESLRQVLNGGYRRGATIARYGGAKAGIVRMNTFAPKAFAGIDTGIPATVKDRSIIIKLTRREDEPVENFKPLKAAHDAFPLRARIVSFMNRSRELLVDAEPDPVFGLDDRASEIAEPLAAIYDLCGSEWATDGRSALTSLLANRNSQDEQVVLLKAIQSAFDGEDKVTTPDLLDILREDIPGLTSRQLAKNCRGWYGAEPTTINIGGDKRSKGYRLMDFAKAFDKYLN